MGNKGALSQETKAQGTENKRCEQGVVKQRGKKCRASKGERNAGHTGSAKVFTETQLAVTAEAENLAPCPLLGAIVPESPAGTGTPVASASMRSHKQYRNHFWPGCK